MTLTLTQQIREAPQVAEFIEKEVYTLGHLKDGSPAMGLNQFLSEVGL